MEKIKKMFSNQIASQYEDLNLKNEAAAGEEDGEEEDIDGGVQWVPIKEI